MTTAKLALFLGGPVHGEVRAMRELVNVINFPRAPEWDPYELVYPVDVPIKFEYETYELVKVRMFGHYLACYVEFTQVRDCDRLAAEFLMSDLAKRITL